MHVSSPVAWKIRQVIGRQEKISIKASLGATKPKGMEELEFSSYSILNKKGILALLTPSGFLVSKLVLTVLQLTFGSHSPYRRKKNVIDRSMHVIGCFFIICILHASIVSEQKKQPSIIGR